MKPKLWIYLAALLLTLTCCNRGENNTLLKQKTTAQNDLIQLLQQIDSIAYTGEFDAVATKEFIDKALEFGNTYPEDPMSAEFLYKAGLMAMTLAKTSETKENIEANCQTALSIFDDIPHIYPDFSGVKNCILNKGVVYDDILHDYQNAEIFYREFIAKYPTDSLAINIESYLQYLGKTPEEILKVISE
jgi:hypothetical protein